MELNMCKVKLQLFANAKGIGLIWLTNISLLHKETLEKDTLAFISLSEVNQYNFTSGKPMEVFSPQLTARQLRSSLGGSGSHGEKKSAKSLTIPCIQSCILNNTKHYSLKLYVANRALQDIWIPPIITSLLAMQ
ncbi:uncharacterized protein J5F26_007094 isoform 2-T3 [Ciconia maguari]